MNFFTKIKTPTALLWTHTRNSAFKNGVSLRFNSNYFDAVRCKVILIIGGKNWQTMDLAENFADAGARAVVIGIPRSDNFFEAAEILNAKYGEDKIITEACDIANPSDLTELFKMTSKIFNKIDIVVNSADVDATIEQTINCNVKSVLFGTFHGYSHMGIHKGGSGGTILNVCSILGLEPFFGSPVYVGTKHFVMGFSRALACDYIQKFTNVKLHTICVGMTSVNSVPKCDSNIPGFDRLNYEKLDEVRKKPVYNKELLNNCLFSVFEDGQNGSIWIIENAEFFKANIPMRNAVKDVCQPS